MPDACTMDIISESREEISNGSPTHVGERFLRFMSEREFYKMMMGEELFNTTDHSKHASTLSTWFCFMSAEGDGTKDIRNYGEFMEGCVSGDMAVVFVNDHASLTDSLGVYADPFGGYWDEIVVDEYCTERYSRRSMVPIYAYRDPFGDLEKVDV